MYWGDHMSGWGWALMGLSTAVFWGLVITGIVLLVRYVGRSSQQSRPTPPTAEELLAARFARGEIDEAEYERRLATLRGQVRA
jgi:putative membrane protein